MTENLGNCKDCRHWDSDGEPHDLLDQKLRQCYRLSRQHLGGLDAAGAYCPGRDVGGNFADFYSLPDFGCNQFERKE